MSRVLLHISARWGREWGGKMAAVHCSIYLRSRNRIKQWPLVIIFAPQLLLLYILLSHVIIVRLKFESIPQWCYYKSQILGIHFPGFWSYIRHTVVFSFVTGLFEKSQIKCHFNSPFYSWPIVICNLVFILGENLSESQIDFSFVPQQYFRFGFFLPVALLEWLFADVCGMT